MIPAMTQTAILAPLLIRSAEEKTHQMSKRSANVCFVFLLVIGILFVHLLTMRNNVTRDTSGDIELSGVVDVDTRMSQNGPAACESKKERKGVRDPNNREKRAKRERR